MKTLHTKKVLSPLKNFLMSLSTWICLSAVTLNKTQTLFLPLSFSSHLLNAISDTACHSYKEKSHCRSRVTVALDKNCLYHRKLLEGMSTAGGRGKGSLKERQWMEKENKCYSVLAKSKQTNFILKYNTSNKIFPLSHLKIHKFPFVCSHFKQRALER